jgi:hypothetical protein
MIEREDICIVLMKHLIEKGGAHPGEEPAYLATFEFLKEEFGRRDGHSLNRQQIELHKKIKVKSVASIMTIFSFFTLPKIYKMRRLSSYIKNIVDSRILQCSISNMQIPLN